MMRKAYSYIRMSTVVQLKGDSLRRQLELSKKYAKENNLELVESIEGVFLQDIGVSGYRGKNSEIGALKIFLDALTAGKIESNSVLLIESLDRLSRDIISAALLQFLAILENGIEIITLSDKQRYTKESVNKTPHLLYASLAVMMRANEESDIKSKRIKAVWENKRRNIKTEKLTTVCPGWLTYDETAKKFLLIPDKAAVVSTIFEMCSKTCGVLGIVKHLNSNNVPVFGRGKMWYRSYLIKMINNRAVLGEFQPGTRVDGVQLPLGDPIEHYYPPVVTEDAFLAAQAAIERRTKNTRGPKGSTFVNLLAGLVYCKTCRVRMIYRNRGDLPKHGKFLICSNRANGIPCAMSEWKYEDTVKTIINHLYEIDFSRVGTGNNSDLAKFDDHLETLDLKLKDLARRESRLTELLISEDNLTDHIKANFVSKLTEISIEITEKKRQASELKSLKQEHEEAQAALRTSDLKKIAEDFDSKENDYYWRSSVNELLRRAISRIEFDEIVGDTTAPSIFPPEPSTKDENGRVTIKIRSVQLQLGEIKPSEITITAFKESIDRKFWEIPKKPTKQIHIQYKTGDTRIIEIARTGAVSVHQNPLDPGPVVKTVFKEKNT